MTIQVVQQEALEFTVLVEQRGAERRQRRRFPHVGQGLHGVVLDMHARGVHQVENQRVDDAAHGFGHHTPSRQGRIFLAHLRQVAGENPDLAQLFQRDQSGAQAVVDIVVVVGDLVRQIGDLRFERRLLLAEKTLADHAELLGIGKRAVLENAFARLEREIQAVELRIALLQQIDHAQRLQIMFEAAVFAHAGVQRVLAGMAEGGMAEIMRERHRLHQVFVQPQQAGGRAADLRHLDAVGEPGTEQVALVVDEHLGLVLQPPERGGMDDAVAVALEFGTRRREGLRMLPPAGLTGMRGVGG